MKNSIFLLTLGVLTAAVVAVSFIFIGFSQGERTRLVDEQLQVIAGSLVSSNIDVDRLEEAGDRIAEALGEDRIYTAVTLYSPLGEILYRNDNGQKILRGAPLPTKPERYYHQRGNHHLRILNLRIMPSGVLIQVGLLLDNTQVRWSWATKNSLFYVGLIFAILVFAASVLSRLLIKPLGNLRRYLEHLSGAIAEGRKLPEVPHSFGVVGMVDEGDEFQRLAQTVRTMGSNLQSRFSLSQAAAAQMAHELKTPLTIIQNQLELARSQVSSAQTEKTENSLSEGISQVKHLNEIISEFLDWSFLRSSPQHELFVVRFDQSAVRIVEQLNQSHKNRIQLDTKSPLTVFATEEGVSQLIGNLLNNALKFSPPDSPVVLQITATEFSVRDQGPGLPPQVLERLGQPFNSGPRIPGVKSTGLGLAWVKALCDRYGWNLSFNASSAGNTVRVSVAEDAAE